MKDLVKNNYYRQAAVAYLIYGIIYLAGAIYLSTLGLSDRGSMENMGWIWYAVGALMVIGIPYLIWREIRWFTLLIAVFMMYRVYELIRIAMQGQQDLIPMPWGGEMARSTGALIFATVAVLTMGMLLRAGLLYQEKVEESIDHT